MAVAAERARHGRERLLVGLGLFAVIAVIWAWLVPAARDMYGAMDGLAAWMMAASWDLRYGLLIFAMWAAMMLGMMLPSAIPAILLYHKVVSSSPTAHRPLLRSYAFAGGYAAAWTLFAAAAAALQWRLYEAALLSLMMESASVTFSAAVLITAGVYQWTPLKQRCLTQCRSPLEWLSRHWRAGLRGAFRMGTAHGLYCIGCCWALMLLLFVGGVMSIIVIGAITAFVLVEKLLPLGRWAGRITGTLLAAAGTWLLVSPL